MPSSRSASSIWEARRSTSTSSNFASAWHCANAKRITSNYFSSRDCWRAGSVSDRSTCALCETSAAQLNTRPPALIKLEKRPNVVLPIIAFVHPDNPSQHGDEAPVRCRRRIDIDLRRRQGLRGPETDAAKRYVACSTCNRGSQIEIAQHRINDEREVAHQSL